MDHRVLFAISALISSAAFAANAPPIFGFSPEQTAAQKSIEQRFDADIAPVDLDAWMKRLSSEPNQVGAPHNEANAEFVRDQFRSWGWDAQIEEFRQAFAPKSPSTAG